MAVVAYQGSCWVMWWARAALASSEALVLKLRCNEVRAPPDERVWRRGLDGRDGGQQKRVCGNECERQIDICYEKEPQKGEQTEQKSRGRETYRF
jgi:hypothetical protein